MNPSRRRRRLRLASGALVALAAIAAGTTIAVLHAEAPSGKRASGASTSTSTSTTTTTVPDSTTTTTQPPPTAIGTYNVASTSLVVTVPGPAPQTQLPTAIWYPVTPAAGHKAFPLLVFSQGYMRAVKTYVVLLHDWASAGFVVAAPSYPHTTPTRAATSPDTRDDIVHHPEDLAVVVTAVVSTSRQSGSPLHGILDASELGLVGQSDGGDVSLAAADNSCCRIPGVKALAVLSGSEYVLFHGQYFPAGTTAPPILVTQGTADTINAPGCSVQIFDSVPKFDPKYYLNLLGATHLAPYIESTGWQSTVAKVTTDFFDAELSGEPSGLAAMTVDGNVSGSAQLSTGPTAPQAPGYCPTSPGPG